MTKLVLITGASKGIGKSCAYKFASLGYDIIITYNKDEEKAINVKEDIVNKYQVNVNIYQLDISKEENVKSFYDVIKDKYHKLDILVNNAGISLDNDPKDKTAEEFMQVIKVNLLGTFLMIKYFSQLMDIGSIINVASTNGIDTMYPESMDYDASKSGIISLTKNYAKYLAPKIRVNAVAPGWVETDMNKELSPLFRKDETKKIFLNRFGNPEEIANVIVFLASESASYIDGEIIRVDGGY